MSEDDAVHPVDRHVGGRIRVLRRALNMPQTHLAAALGVSFQQVQKYERAANRVSASKLYEIAGLLGVTYDDLFEGLPKPGPGLSPEAVLAVRRHDASAAAPEGSRLLAAFVVLPAELRRALLTAIERMGA